MAFCALVCGWLLPFYEVHPLGADDAACLGAPAWHESAPLKLEARSEGDGQPAHCDVCHLMRAMRGAVAADGARLVAPHEATSGPSLTDSFALPAVQAAPSSRGPPATSSI
ncbi:MAG: hypothetical protein A3J29_10530 [Acidobacteria bacterium RIFCSPLOWO2_12_FULL_67_14b]|nr:MAG: hypothetical protein A3J29_10530 [Acidobacteria bacterium RIFCSPLOWO2_12_FULL_67_14b]